MEAMETRFQEQVDILKQKVENHEVMEARSQEQVDILKQKVENHEVMEARSQEQVVILQRKVANHENRLTTLEVGEYAVSFRDRILLKFSAPFGVSRIKDI